MLLRLSITTARHVPIVDINGVIRLMIFLLKNLKTFVVVFLVLSQTKANSTVAADGNATRAVDTLGASAETIPAWVPLVVIAVIGALLLSLVALFRR